jgi:hypothetical protein
VKFFELRQGGHCVYSEETLFPRQKWGRNAGQSKLKGACSRCRSLT